MEISLPHLALLGFIYIGLLFGIAYATEKGLIPERLSSHPVVYILSLGIFASAFSYYGVIELGYHFGYGALAYYLGAGVFFTFAPLLLKPLVELSRRFQTTSMADLLTLRYNSNAVGAMTTVTMLLVSIPLLILQIQAVAYSLNIVMGQHSTENQLFGRSVSFADLVTLGYCLIIISFALLFGSNRSKLKGLITAMAFESVVKLIGILLVGGFCIFSVFGGFGGLETWLNDNPIHIQRLYEPLSDSRSHMLVLVFLSTAVAMPHVFQLAVVENANKNATYTVSWAIPLFMLFMALPIFPILWAGIKLGSTVPFEYFSLSAPMLAGNEFVTIISFLAGFSAATGAMIAMSLSLATMIMNHLVLPASSLTLKKEIYSQIRSMRRVFIASVILCAFFCYLILNRRYSLTDLAMVSFIAALQLIPSILCVTYWPEANRKGFAAGLIIGMGIWFVGLVLPMLSNGGSGELLAFINTLPVGMEHWNSVALWSIALNVIAFTVVSLLTRQSEEERYAAEICSDNELSHPVRMVLEIRDSEEMIERLGERVGESTARHEVTKAMKKLNMNASERRPYSLRLLRDEVEANLSGLLGIALASEIMDSVIPLRIPESDGATDINMIEDRLNHYHDHLSGLAAELDSLRLYHRRTLEELPLASCSIGRDYEILMWNVEMQALTGIKSEDITGSRVSQLPEPWGPLLKRFANSDENHFYREEIDVVNDKRWLSLHKSAIPSSLEHRIEGQVILIEDTTEMQTLEKELLHSERLASVGRLAAGVAHEIGNPITGIDCLAQNLKYETETDDIVETADQILSQTKRVGRIVQSLVSFSHAGKNSVSDFGKVDLSICASEAISLLQLRKDKRQMRFENRIAAGTHVRGDEQRLIQVFVNLLANAQDACESDTLIRITAKTVSNQIIECNVEDEGPGIPEKIQDRILEPFFTTKDPGEGTGLGLSMVYSIIQDHEGTMELISPSNVVEAKGTKFVIKLPLYLASETT